MFSAAGEQQALTLVVGLGNPILSDDGVGWRVADALELRLADDEVARAALGEVEIDRLAVGGLQLMERLVGYDRVVLADAIIDGSLPGTIWTKPLADVTSRLAGHLDSAHDVPLSAALAAGSTLGARLPAEVTVVGVAVSRVNEFGEELTPAVAAAVEPAVDAILAVLRHGREGTS